MGGLASQDSTVLTIAHRLNTIVDSDRIMTLEQGTLKEFDNPKTLMNKPDGLFAALWKQHSISHSSSRMRNDSAATSPATSPSLLPEAAFTLEVAIPTQQAADDAGDVN